MAKVSIIIPSYNHERFLKKRLESISSQTFKDWEAIIIDDKSSDCSVSFITEFLTQHLNFRVKHFIKNENNSGSGYNSWKRGIELAETEYIWIAETDDYSENTFLEELVSILDANQSCSLAFCTSNYVENENIVYDSTNRTKDLKVETGNFKILSNEIFLKRMPFNTYITNGSSVVFRKPVEAIPNEIFDNRLCSDLFLWSYLVQDRNFAFLNKSLNFFRRHEGSISSYLQKNKLESVYHEKAKFLNYFGQTSKWKEFIKHYIKYYIWSHKKDFLNTASIQKLEIDKNLKINYFMELTFVFFKKLLRR